MWGRLILVFFLGFFSMGLLQLARHVYWQNTNYDIENAALDVLYDAKQSNRQIRDQLNVECRYEEKDMIICYRMFFCKNKGYLVGREILYDTSEGSAAPFGYGSIKKIGNNFIPIETSDFDSCWREESGR